VTMLIIAVNLALFFYEASLPPRQLEFLIRNYAIIPSHYLAPGRYSLEQLLWPLVTAMFLHGGWLHVIGNMWYLWVFGDNVEDQMGRWNFLLFYLLAGLVGNVAHIIADPFSRMPTIGASGAVAGVLGAYLVLFPRARVLALIPVLIFITITEVPAVIFIFLWFLLQLVNGLATLGVPTQATAGVAWWAHIGGFLTGFFLAPFFRHRRPYYW